MTADFKPLLRRYLVAYKTRAERKVFYDRARTRLANAIASEGLSLADATRARLRLEDAIRVVDAEIPTISERLCAITPGGRLGPSWTPNDFNGGA